MSDESAVAPDAEPADEPDAANREARGSRRRPRERLDAIRADPTRRRIALAVAALLGLAVAWVHWLGLFVAGALVGLVSKTLARALVAGLAVGVLVLAAHVLASPAMNVGEFLVLAPVAYVTVAAALIAPLLGSLVRGVV